MGETVRLLPRIAPELEPEDRNRLTFLALNRAGRSRCFDQSSNFLAVRLAEIFGGNHIAVLDHTDKGAEEEYKSKVQSIDLLICGAGGPADSLLVKHANEQNVQIPKEMVGDFAFIPLGIDGRPLRDGTLASVLQNLSPRPEYAEVLRITRDPSKEVIVIFNNTDSKLSVAHAILTAGLATHCVLSVSFAERLLEKHGSAHLRAAKRNV